MSMRSQRGIEAGKRWTLRLLGGFELLSPAGERVGLPGKRERLLLAYLALTRNHRQTRAKLALLLWGDAANEATVDNLRTCLWGVRKALGDTEHRALVSEGEDIVLDPSYFDVDALIFERCSAEADRVSLETAANLYAGDLLDGLDVDSEDFEAWRRAETHRYRDCAARVLLGLMTVLDEAGETERAIETGARLMGLEPLHEAAARRLMRLYRDGGRRGAAIDVYRTLEATLRDELGAAPEPETQAVLAEIARSGDEHTAHGRESVARAPRDDTATGNLPAARKPNLRLRMGLGVAGLGLLAIVTYWLTSALPHSVSAVTGPPSTLGTISIVVLPFANLSGDPSQEFFSDGMTEEVTTALAKIPNLRVVARSSAFQFKNQSQDVRLVAQTLGATHLVEGAVRRDGPRVRISAQLVDADSGTDLWAETYEREFDNMFAIQDDIAKAIGTALRIPLGLRRDQSLTLTHIGDLDTYQKFLRARTMVHSRGYGSLAEAATLLQEIVKSDPDYAPAWAYLAQAYVFALNYHPAWISGDFETLRPLVAELMPKAETAARRATELDPTLADGFALLALTLELRGELARAEDLYRQAIALDPTNPDVLHFYSRLLAEVGRLKEALAMRQQIQALDPFVPVYNWVTAWLFWLNGDTDVAIALSTSLPPLHRSYTAPQLLASIGRYDDAADLIAASGSGVVPPSLAEVASTLMRSAPARAASPETLPKLGWLNFIYLHVGALDRTLEFYEDGVDAGYSVSISNAFLWHPYYAALRKTQRYKDFMKKRGVVAYWRSRGWPEQCHSLGANDFACE